mmetsp:Transcript_39800/g.62540  ORF Transcript_39800/g.62540 Transcript_39800/m.62540 type:complete len:106 (-) Transcript_39800:440-757(-)
MDGERGPFCSRYLAFSASSCVQPGLMAGRGEASVDSVPSVCVPELTASGLGNTEGTATVDASDCQELRASGLAASKGLPGGATSMVEVEDQVASIGALGTAGVTT